MLELPHIASHVSERKHFCRESDLALGLLAGQKFEPFDVRLEAFVEALEALGSSLFEEIDPAFDRSKADARLLRFVAKSASELRESRRSSQSILPRAALTLLTRAVVNTSTSQRVAEYRFVHQYSFNQSPEQHAIRFSGREGFAVTNLRVGHSYGVPAAAELWQFRSWMTELGTQRLPLSSAPAEVRIDWSGRLPYPEGEDVTGRIPQKQRDDSYPNPNRRP